MSAGRVDRLVMRTPEGAEFSYRLAGPVLRLLALAVDLAVIAAADSVLAKIFAVLLAASSDMQMMFTLIGYFVISQGYFITMEWHERGQTFGKRLLRLRVVDVEGLHLGLGQIVIRNVVRFVDGLPFAYLVGGCAVMLSRKGQRLGDVAAGTAVVWEREDTPPNAVLLGSEKFNSLRQHPAAVARLRQAVTPAEAAIAARALARRDQLEDAARVRLFADVAERLRTLVILPIDAIHGITDEQLVRNMVEVLYSEVPIEGTRAPR
jgi:uncharacterized RDD family membrane protein YckC